MGVENNDLVDVLGDEIEPQYHSNKGSGALHEKGIHVEKDSENNLKALAQDELGHEELFSNPIPEDPIEVGPGLKETHLQVQWEEIQASLFNGPSGFREEQDLNGLLTYSPKTDLIEDRDKEKEF